MAKLTLEEVKDYEVLPDETLILVEVEKIEVRHVPGKNGGDGWDKLEFKCIIRDLPTALLTEEGYQNLIGSPIWGSVAMKFTMHPDNKLRQWAEALMNMGELDAGFELDTDLLEGRQAKAVTGHYERKDGTKRHQIDGLLPPGPLGGAQAMPDFLTQTRPTEAAPVSQAPAQPATPPVQQPAQPVMVPDIDDDPPF